MANQSVVVSRARAPSGVIALLRITEEAQEQDEISRNLQMLYLVDESKKLEASERLKTIAGQSTDRKEEIVSRLIKVLQDPAADYETRRAAMVILGDLKAARASNVLTQHLTDLGGTAGLSEQHFPAIQALHKIGAPAIPDLSRALNSSDPQVRKLSTRALAAIGGEQARDVLQRALQTEKNADVRERIASALEHISATRVK
jgi:HEAT repeat protein